MIEPWLDDIQWTSDGLVPVVAQEAETGEVLMLAWMNRAALAATAARGEAVYWSRSRQRLWRKGERSGHAQVVKSLRLDCDRDALLLEVEQRGGVACHTGRRRCFYRRLDTDQWVASEPVLKEPASMGGEPGDE